MGSVYGDVSVDAQIEQIMNAPANERVGLMNQLKIKLAGMNNSERNEALQKLQGDTNHGWSNGSAMIHTGFTSAPMQQMNTNTQMQPINKVPMQNQGQR
ncbi:MAG: hypothetical protein ACXW33_08640 [Sulfuricurvum sp.]